MTNQQQPGHPQDDQVEDGDEEQTGALEEAQEDAAEEREDARGYQ